MTTEVLTIGRTVLRQEADALTLMANDLDYVFEQCVEMIVNTEGRIAVTGIGKSGHVGHKIAATFSSTGTPAYFIHPVEALHGDLGMIVPNDILIVISNSGNTEEMAGILQYATQNGLLIIAITGNLDSKLGKIATHTLLLPQVKEACPLECAPTVSSTVTLAIGDALAMAVLHKRGFSVRDFNKYHPGGSLGKQLKNVSEVMYPKERLPLIYEEDNADVVVRMITDKGFGCVGVIASDGKLIGIITDGDLRRSLNTEFAHKCAKDMMSKNPIIVTHDTMVTQASYIMKSKKITTLFVVNTVEDAIPIGLLTINNCL